MKTEEEVQRDIKNRKPRITGNGFLTWLYQLGLIPLRTRRVVIDAAVDTAVLMYIERFGSKELISVELPKQLEGAEITILSKGDKDVDQQ